MVETISPLEQIFDTICQEYELPVDQNNRGKTARGQIYFLELENMDDWTRLRYIDRVAAADFWDCGDQKYLVYTILSTYQDGQNSFLQTQDSNIAKNLLEKLTAEESQTDKHVLKIDLNDFSEVEAFLSAHIENY